MFRRLLIANRGEIACRILRTANRLGIHCIAVFSDADARAQHVMMADEAHRIGTSAAGDSYLRIDRIVAVAEAVGADAIHPGYGFLSENADFAEACTAASIAFVGPPASAIRAMGSKAGAKAIMVKAGVSVVPGYHGEDQSEERLLVEAGRIGFPVLIKASAGGGGKGMRPVFDAQRLTDEVAGAKREALAAFGNDRVILERYLHKPRHVEVQVLADKHGQTLHLHTRDCSVQRRHQKVLEEAPAPGLSTSLRQRLQDAAVAAAKAVGYFNAGTVEFIVQGDDAYFMEMNTRLQVEHPVTEMISDIDLVEWQLRVAAGERLTFNEAPSPRGHAVEVRLYAEDPAEDFRPSVGTLRIFSTPDPSRFVRVDGGVRSGDVITPHYDPMLAKIVAWGEDRGAALARLSRALAEVQVVGPTVNLAFLRRLVNHPALLAGDLDTNFVTRHAETLVPPPQEVPAQALACLAAVLRQNQRIGVSDASPWDALRGFRMCGPAEDLLVVHDGVRDRRILMRDRRGTMEVAVDDGQAVRVEAHDEDARRVALNGVWRTIAVLVDGSDVRLSFGAEAYELRLIDPYVSRDGPTASEGRLSAPIPGRVVEVFVKVGDRVTRGQTVAILEAMKTELRITAPADGFVAHVGCVAGENVEEGTEIVTLAPPSKNPQGL